MYETLLLQLAEKETGAFAGSTDILTTVNVRNVWRTLRKIEMLTIA